MSPTRFVSTNHQALLQLSKTLEKKTKTDKTVLSDCQNADHNILNIFSHQTITKTNEREKEREGE